MKKTKEEMQAIAAKAIKTGQMANTLAKALAQRHSKRWQFADFLGPKKRESAGIVDILAIRKSGKTPPINGLKKLDLFEIMIIQVKGGGAALPSDEEIKRMKLVAKHYHADKIVLFQWKKENAKMTEYSVLGAKNKWERVSAAKLFG